MDYRQYTNNKRIYHIMHFIKCRTPAREFGFHANIMRMPFTLINCTSYLCVMKYLRYKIVSILDGDLRAHIYTVYIVFNNIVIEVFGHKFYVSMECVTLCVTIHGYYPQNNNLEKKKHISY